MGISPAHDKLGVTMPGLPFHCSRCGTRFTQGGIFVGEGSTDILISDAQVTCPNCGAMARQAFPATPFSVRGGRFVFAGSIARLLVAARVEASADDYERLIDLSKAALATDISEADWVRSVEATPFRDLIRVWERLPSHKRATLQVLIGLLLWLQPQLFPLPRLDEDEKPVPPPAITTVTDEQADEIAQRVLEGMEARGEQLQEPPIVQHPSRNSPCPCGKATQQGKSISYKRCHGALQR